MINVIPADGPTTAPTSSSIRGSTRSPSRGRRRPAARSCASAPIRSSAHTRLGGQEPEPAFADAELDSAIPRAVWSIYYAAGQSCEARSRVLVERSIDDDVVSAFTEKASTIRRIQAIRRFGTWATTAGWKSFFKPEAPYSLPLGKTLRLRFGLYIHEGQPAAADLNVRWQAFAKSDLEDLTPKK